MKEEKLLYKDLTYNIRGLLFETQNEIGRFCNEKQCGDAFVFKLKRAGYFYEREKVLPISFPGEKLGRNRIDFLIEHVLIIELKNVPALTKDHYYQCQRYLVALNLDLALLVNFRPKYLMIKRILNHQKYNRERNFH